ncbi:hypothetical protein CTM50_03360 [Prevotella intermedia]|uniref:Uncharacterized protein n=1 Tax=Prevotella intermedia TaxID=28131 RepID=A0A2D3NGJ7_PREIN|nr:hypothetical protein CTM50_03360 [Prevotella intermedia]
MHGKSGCFASQNLHFRNAKSKLPFFVRIIFTKPRRFSAFVEAKFYKNHLLYKIFSYLCSC